MKIGDKVRVTDDGPFKGLEGTVIRQDLFKDGKPTGSWIVYLPEQKTASWTNNAEGWILPERMLEITEEANPDDPEYEAARQKWAKILQ